jgi:hypothetical protein
MTDLIPGQNELIICKNLAEGVVEALTSGCTPPNRVADL